MCAPDYVTRLELYYDRCLDKLDFKLPFRHFGLTVEFETPVEFALHGEVRRFDFGLRAVLQRYGFLAVTNATLLDRVRTCEQRIEIFSFHTVWVETQGDTVTMFWPDPIDPVQRKPRRSSILIVANAVAYLQAIKEGCQRE